jgi:hypothetical protein
MQQQPGGGGVLLLSEQNQANMGGYMRQKKAGTGKYASNTPQINTPNRSIDFTSKAGGAPFMQQNMNNMGGGGNF